MKLFQLLRRLPRGRTLTDYIETKQRLLALEEETGRRAGQLEDIARALRHGAALAELDVRAAFDVAKTLELARELDQAKQRKAELQRRLRGLGLEDLE